MPQPRFEFELSMKDRENAGKMMAHMVKVASELGGYMPGSEPQFLNPGLPLHIGGTTRMGAGTDASVAAGTEVRTTTVVDSESKMWDVENLYLGGNGLHPFGNAGNPTLTSVAMAIRASDAIVKYLQQLKP